MKQKKRIYSKRRALLYKINGTDDFLENIAMCEENLLESFLETGTITKKDVAELILERKLFPCFFGSALKMEGVDAFIHGMETYMAVPSYPAEFGARIFKIARDGAGKPSHLYEDHRRQPEG